MLKLGELRALLVDLISTVLWRCVGILISCADDQAGAIINMRSAKLSDDSIANLGLGLLNPTKLGGEARLMNLESLHVIDVLLESAC